MLYFIDSLASQGNPRALESMLDNARDLNVKFTKIVACCQVHVEVTIPQKVGGDEKRLVEELRELTSKQTKSKWF